MPYFKLLFATMLNIVDLINIDDNKSYLHFCRKQLIKKAAKVRLSLMLKKCIEITMKYFSQADQQIHRWIIVSVLNLRKRTRGNG